MNHVIYLLQVFLAKLEYKLSWTRPYQREHQNLTRSTAYSIPVAVGILDGKRETTFESAQYFYSMARTFKILSYWYRPDTAQATVAHVIAQSELWIFLGSMWFHGFRFSHSTFVAARLLSIHYRSFFQFTLLASGPWATKERLQLVHTLANWWIGACVSNPLRCSLSWRICRWNCLKCSSTLGWKLPQPVGKTWLASGSLPIATGWATAQNQNPWMKVMGWSGWSFFSAYCW